MQSKGWQEIENVFHAALVLPAEERSAYLADACSGRNWLSIEVESLLEAFESRNGFMDQPAFDLALEVLRLESPESLAGKAVGPYQVLAPLGKGGMGEVYLAEDTRLGRKVALKFLSGEFVGDNWAKRQLIREAQAVAILDHPNICPVYGIEEHNDHNFIVMQYVEGETLAQLIHNQCIQPKQFVNLAQQIVGAVAEAHAHGIIHRDIKPKNIMVTPSGQVKVLDFGLAKITQQKQSIENAVDSISHLSQTGLIQGTVAYMSPEQLRAEKLDFRSDIFSLGTVLYEVISGKNPYGHESNADIISAILTKEPPSLRINSAQIPRELDRIIQKCIEKEKPGRYQSASELLFELEKFQTTLKGEPKEDRYIWIRVAAAAIPLFLLVAVLMFVYSNVTKPRTLAILPIVNETGDKTLDYLSDGLTESLIDRLSGLSKLRVKSFSMVAGYKGQLDPQKIGRELNVDAVVIGNTTGTKDAPSFRVIMINSEDGTQLWAETYKLELNEIVQAQEEVCRQITSHLEYWPESDREKIAQVHRPPQAAFDEYLRGRDYWRFRDEENIKRAIEHFDAATKHDPSYARAYAGLSDSYVLLNVVSYGHMDTKEAMSKAEWAAKRAIEIDEKSAEAHTSLGAVEMRYHWNWAGAEREFKRAIQLKPDYAPAHHWYSNLLAIMGNVRESIAESERAKDLDPFSPVASMNYCRALYVARQYDDADACFVKLSNDQPGYTNGQYVHAFVYIKQGRYLDAIRIFEALYSANKRAGGAALGYAYGIAGRKEDARRVLSEMLDLMKLDYLPPQEIALIYLGLGDGQNTFIWLNKAADERFAPLASITVDPLFDTIRSDERFDELLKKLSLPSPA